MKELQIQELISTKGGLAFWAILLIVVVVAAVVGIAVGLNETK